MMEPFHHQQEQHAALMGPLRFYHFASQNVLLTKQTPSHMGMADDDRVWILYEKSKTIEIYRYGNVANMEIDQNGNEMKDNLIPKADEYHLERVLNISPDDHNIVQCIYCPLLPDFFALLTNEHVRIYTNYEVPNQTLFFRTSGQLIATLSGNRLWERPHPMENVTAQFNVIAFPATLKANNIDCCPVKGNLVVSQPTDRSVLIYQCTRCVLPFESHSPVSIDFVHITTVFIEDGFVPTLVKLSLNYLAMMCPDHFTLIQLLLRSDFTASKHKHCYEYATDCTLVDAQTMSQVHYSRLFDIVAFSPSRNMVKSPFPKVVNGHAERVWGPCDNKIGCTFVVSDYEEEMEKSTGPYNLLFCQQFIHKTVGGSISYDCQLLPYQDRDGQTYAHGLFIQHENSIEAYLVDLRRSKQHLIPISSIKLVGNIKHFCVNLRQDTIHILTDTSELETYCSHLLSLLVSDRAESLVPSNRSTIEMHLMSECRFFNLQSTFSSNNSILLTSGPSGMEEMYDSRTAYVLRRPSFDLLQADVLSGIDDLRSISMEADPRTDHRMHQMYRQLYSLSRVVHRHPLWSLHSRANGGEHAERVERFHRQVREQIQEIIELKVKCNHLGCWANLAIDSPSGDINLNKAL